MTQQRNCHITPGKVKRTETPNLLQMVEEAVPGLGVGGREIPPEGWAPRGTVLL